jgi:AraC-type DNA-binding domain-containing proteins
MRAADSNEGIRKIYSGELGEIRNSSFQKLNKSFSQSSNLSIKYVLSGQENYFFQKEQFSLEAGHALFLKDEESFQCNIDFPTVTSGICVDLNFDQLSQSVFDPLIEEEMFFFDPEFSTQRVTFLNEQIHVALRRIVAANSEENQLYFQEVMYDLMMEVLKMEGGLSEKIRSIPVKKRSYQKELFRRLLNAKNYINDQRFQKVSLKSIAKHSFLSEFYLHRLFSRVFGYSPSSYLEQLRMKEATIMLQKGHMIKDVCFKIGYNDVSYFCRRFKLAHGKTPKQFQLGSFN